MGVEAVWGGGRLRAGMWNRGRRWYGWVTLGERVGTGKRMDAQGSPTGSERGGEGAWEGAGAPVAGRAFWGRELSWWRRMVRNALVAGAVVSVAVHIVALVVASLISLRGPGGEGTETKAGSGGVEMAVMTEAELGSLGAIGEATVTAGEVALDRAAEERLAGPPGDEAVGPAALSGGGLTGGGGDVGAEGINAGGGGAGGGGTSFFGVEARGDRFVYIVDVSGSMFGGRIEELRAQLTASIMELTETSSFLVLLFSDGTTVLGDKLEWSEASARNKSWARQAISTDVRANGGTKPLDAFRKALAMRPRPDAIFFMTDGAFEDDVVAFVARDNRNPRVKVHCICFEDNSSDARMRQIAKDSGGTYTFVPGRRP